jgi:hypothetical protein
MLILGYGKRQLIGGMAIAALFLDLTIHGCKVRFMSRACIIWDFRTNAKGLGDTLELLVAAELLCEDYKVEKVDVILVCDPKEPNRGTWDTGSVTPGNYHATITGYISLLYTNTHIGNVSILDSDVSVEEYMAGRSYKVVYPTMEEFRSRLELQDRIMDWVWEFNSTYGYIPKLTILDSLKHWAYDTLGTFLPKLPIVVAIRNNPWNEGVNRNADLNQWHKFFLSYADIPVHFLLIGSWREKDWAAIFNDLPNVTHSKTYYTSIAQDVALVHCAPFFIGTASGLCSIAIFGDIPHGIFRWSGLHVNRGLVQCPFLKSRHYLYPQPETVDTLTDITNNLYEYVDNVVWEEEVRRWKAYEGPTMWSNSTWA